MKLKVRCYEVIKSEEDIEKIAAREDVLEVARNSDAIVEMIYDATGCENVKFRNGSMYLVLGDVSEEEAEEACENLRAVLTSKDFKDLVKAETYLVADEDDDPDMSDEELMTLQSTSASSYLRISNKVSIVE